MTQSGKPRVCIEMMRSPLVLAIIGFGLVSLTLLCLDMSWGRHGSPVAAAFGLPSDLEDLFSEPWRLVLYSFVHSSVMHLVMNLLVLFVFGMALAASGMKMVRFLILFLCGGVAGGLLYVSCFGYMLSGHGILLGSSAAVMAVVVYSAVVTPARRLVFPGNPTVLQGFLVIVAFAVSALLWGGDNLGGAIAHIGGVLAGFGASFMGYIRTAFNSRKEDISDQSFSYGDSPDTEMRQLQSKVERSGFTSLTEEEKKRMFELSKCRTDD